ncbi:MAG: hypothetical protein RLY93_16985 [Sumerlaeia bacterium]
MKPIPKTFTSPLAAREFELVSNQDSRCLTIEIGVPIRDVETAMGDDWRCPIRITCGGKVELTCACGVDAMQAIELAIRLVPVLARSTCQEGERVMRWGETLERDDAEPD